MLSRTAKHALRAAVVLAQTPRGQFRGASSIAEEIGAPQNYLGKLLKTLAERGVLVSQKGMGGGFQLAKLPEKTTLFEVVEPFDNVTEWTGCLMGNGKCSTESPCVLHDKAAFVRDAYLKMLCTSTLAEVLKSPVF
jgi:Rrf2 family transcriptional regulator, iron-sulfur cluster assembly transcription factor